MEKDNVKYNAYIQILKEELLPAMYGAHCPGLWRCIGQKSTGGSAGQGGYRGERKYHQEREIRNRS